MCSSRMNENVDERLLSQIHTEVRLWRLSIFIPPQIHFIGRKCGLNSSITHTFSNITHTYTDSTHTFFPSDKAASNIAAQHFIKLKCSNIALIRECGSTLYVGLARTAPPTNTNFRLTFFTNPTSGGSL